MEFLLRQTSKGGKKTKVDDYQKTWLKKTMISERHMNELGHVMVANVVGWLPTFVQFESGIRVLGLLLAAIYTSIKIIQSVREK